MNIQLEDFLEELGLSPNSTAFKLTMTIASHAEKVVNAKGRSFRIAHADELVRVTKLTENDYAIRHAMAAKQQVLSGLFPTMAVKTLLSLLTAYEEEASVS